MHGLLATDMDSENIIGSTPVYSANSAVIGDVKIENRMIPTPEGPRPLTTVEKPFEDKNKGLQGFTMEGTGLTVINSNPTYPTTLKSKKDRLEYIDIHELGHAILGPYFDADPDLEEYENRKLHDEFFEKLKGVNPDTAGDMMKQMRNVMQVYGSDVAREYLSRFEERGNRGCERIKRVIKESNLDILGFYKKEIEKRERQKYAKNLDSKMISKNSEGNAHRDLITGEFKTPKKSDAKFSYSV